MDPHVFELGDVKKHQHYKIWEPFKIHKIFMASIKPLDSEKAFDLVFVWDTFIENCWER